MIAENRAHSARAPVSSVARQRRITVVRYKEPQHDRDAPHDPACTLEEAIDYAERNIETPGDEDVVAWLRKLSVDYQDRVLTKVAAERAIVDREAQALRRLVAALPKCQWGRCQNVATYEQYDCFDCDEHKSANSQELPYATVLREVEVT